MTVRTRQSQIAVAIAARTTVWQDDKPAATKYRLVDEEFEIGHEIFAEMAEGQSLVVDKVVTLVTGRDVATSEPAAGAERRLGRQGRFGEILDGHALAWAHIWERLSIEFEDHADELRILRLHLMHLLQTVSQNSEDLDIGVPARGLHGEAYRGHVFWDELFIFPVLNLRFPTITRALLRYRYRRLIEARRAAKLAGYAGAMFPWQSGSDGREESPESHLNPRSGRWNPDPSHLAHHIGIAVAYNVWQFYQVTGDLAYLIDYGAEMLIEIARFWVSRTTYEEHRGRYGIHGVIGPDEFHSGYPDRKYDGVDNNAYTNVMAVWVILRAMDALETLPLPNRIDLREKLGLTDEELAQWEQVSRRMFVPFHDGVISQFEGYDELAELDWEAYRARYGSIHRLDRILEAENDDVNRYQASKQADALMLLYLLSSDELARAARPARLRPSGRADPEDGRLLHRPHLARVDAQCRCAFLGLGPRQSRSRDGVLSAGSQVRRRRHPGRHHLRGHPPRGDGRKRRPRAAVLHRAGDPGRPHRLVSALAGVTWCTGISDSLPWAPPVRAGQRKGC